MSEPEQHREKIEPWLSALFQAEHLNLVVGSGFTTAVSGVAGAPVVDMSPVSLGPDYADAVAEAAQRSAKGIGREKPNIEDQVRTVVELISGLNVLAERSDGGNDGDSFRLTALKLLVAWQVELDSVLGSLLSKVLETEQGIETVLADVKRGKGDEVRRLLGGFLLPFGSRAATRERTHIFTLNYDRVIEYGCDLLGLRIIDRFVGRLAPVFHSSRLAVDLHYNPPGIRGEPQYLEGVVRLTKLHGSVDWRSATGPSGMREVQRSAVPFGADRNHPEIPRELGDQLLVYPNPAKDVETLEFPYADLFRDFAAAVCQPNAVVLTYGYGFGDDHVNSILRDMLTIPSTHLVVVSYDYAHGRVSDFLENAGHDAQISLLIGPHFGDIETLVEHYLPKPAIDRTTWRMVELLNRRSRPNEGESGTNDAGAQADGATA